MRGEIIGGTKLLLMIMTMVPMIFNCLALLPLLIVVSSSGLARGDGNHDNNDNPMEELFSLALNDQDPLRDNVRRDSSLRRIQTDQPTNTSGNNALQNNYVQECKSFLLTPEIINDGIISQVDFSTFLLHQCRAEELCETNDAPLQFEQLQVSLQLLFINGVCPQEELGDKMECIHDLEWMWRNEGEFGFRMEEDGDADSLSGLVGNMCRESYADVGRMGLTRTLGEMKFDLSFVEYFAFVLIRSANNMTISLETVVLHSLQNQLYH